MLTIVDADVIGYFRIRRAGVNEAVAEESIQDEVSDLSNDLAKLCETYTHIEFVEANIEGTKKVVRS